MSDEHDTLTANLDRLVTALRESPDQTITGYNNVLAATGLSESALNGTIRRQRRSGSGTAGQLAVHTHGRLPADYKWTKDGHDIARQQLRHQRIAYTYSLHVYWAQHQFYDGRQADGAPMEELFELNYALRKDQENLAAMEAIIVNLARRLRVADKRIASFFRQATPNDPVTTHTLVPVVS